MFVIRPDVVPGALMVALCGTLAGCFAVPYISQVPPHQAVAPTTPPTLAQMKKALEDLRTSSPSGCNGFKVSYGMVECTSAGIRMRFADTPTPSATQPASGSNGFAVDARTIDGRVQRFTWGAPAWDGQPQRSANRFADAWAVLAAAARDTGIDAKTFERHALAYAAANPKPELPEEARRFRVQAEAAVRRQEFDVAAEMFSQALEIAPWWPQGRFNLALINSELGLHSRAIAEMRRYLRLVPEAANARQAQDKIYEWEGMGK